MPAEVTALLRCEPSRSHARGDAAESGDHRRVARFGFWGLQADETAPADLDGQVAGLLSRLTDDVAVWQRLRAQYELDLFSGWFMTRWNEGVTIGAGTLAALGARGVVLSIDLWGWNGDGLRRDSPSP